MAITKKSLLSSNARIQIPWVKVTIGTYTFGAFSTNKVEKNINGFYTAYSVQYPNFIESLNVVKINGQVNQYTLSINYPVTTNDDPNFFEKVFSSVSKTRKILFSYGDMSMPSYLYKEEEAIITSVNTSFSFGSGGSMNSVIKYTIKATSSAALGQATSDTFIYREPKVPSLLIKEIFKQNRGNIQSIFTGMSLQNIDKLIDSGDAAVTLAPKENISVIDYINYLVGCMVPQDSGLQNVSDELYVLTIHDDTVYDKDTANPADLISLSDKKISGPYFKVKRVTKKQAHSDAYEIDIGYNTNTIVRGFALTDQQNYSLLYNYSDNILTADKSYTRRLNDLGQWEDVYTPNITSNNDIHQTTSDEIVWWSKVTKFPIKATLTVQGLLRPCELMTYIRINVIFPGGEGVDGYRKHISSGLYMITAQTDTINAQGYTTQLSCTKIDN